MWFDGDDSYCVDKSEISDYVHNAISTSGLHILHEGYEKKKIATINTIIIFCKLGNAQHLYKQSKEMGLLQLFLPISTFELLLKYTKRSFKTSVLFK